MYYHLAGRMATAIDAPEANLRFHVFRSVSYGMFRRLEKIEARTTQWSPTPFLSAPEQQTEVCKF